MEKINFTLLFGHLAVYLLVWLFAITTQGALTAWMSNYFGDDTAKNQGRISFSPFVQADLVGTIIIPAIAFIFSWLGAGIPLIAWGKQVPINSDNWKNPKFAGAMVTMASTFATILIALASLFLLKLLFVTGVANVESFVQVIVGKNNATDVTWVSPIELTLWYSLILNTALTIFSLIPIPPFSGGTVLASLLPVSFKPVVNFFSRFGLIIALLLIYLGVIGYVLNPIIEIYLNILGLF